MEKNHLLATALVLLAVLAAPAAGQMTEQQRVDDFRTLAGLYGKNYGPYEWKRDAVGFDLLRIGPWLDRVRKAKDDLEFLEICSEYVVALQDSHDAFYIPSNFRASLGFSADIYDGKVLVDTINRTTLPARDYPFAIGDELVSVDGRTSQEWITHFLRFTNGASLNERRRFAAARIASRPQIVYPRAHEVGEQAEVVIRRDSGALETYSIPWVKTNVPLTVIGSVLDPFLTKRRAAGGPMASDGDETPDGPGSGDSPAYMAPLHRLWTARAKRFDAVTGIARLQPLFALPDGFAQRLGRSALDDFYSGTFRTADGLRVGFIRIPQMDSLLSVGIAIRQLAAEVAFMQANTDALIVDVMRNPGGRIDFVDATAQLLIPNGFRTLGFEIRVTQFWLLSFQNALQQARNARNPERWVIDSYEFILKEMETAYREKRGRTGPIPLNAYNSLEIPSAPNAYTRPMIVLVDEISASGADALPAILQDNLRALVVGTRTTGAGGNVNEYSAGVYSETFVSLTESLMVRKQPIVTSDFPTAAYVENIGVRPDTELNFMTRENLVNSGKPFIDEAVRILTRHARR